MNQRWITHFKGISELVAQQSKDPSNRVGAVIVDQNKRLISTGFNGFPRNVEDNQELLNDKDRKRLMVIHAEANAILFSRRDIQGYSLFCTHQPCASCASLIIQSGITTVYCPPNDTLDQDFWGLSLQIAKAMFKTANVKIVRI